MMMLVRGRARPDDVIGVGTGTLAADIAGIAVRSFVRFDFPPVQDRTRDRHEDREQRQRGAERNSFGTCRRVTAGATCHPTAQHKDFRSVAWERVG